MNIWYPDEVRSQINDIAENFPNGFNPTIDSTSASGYSSGVQIDLAQLELKRYEVRLLLLGSTTIRTEIRSHQYISLTYSPSC